MEKGGNNKYIKIELKEKTLKKIGFFTFLSFIIIKINPFKKLKKMGKKDLAIFLELDIFKNVHFWNGLAFI